MSVYSGLGVNYRSLQANWATDVAYFRSIGVTSIRPVLPAVPYPWVVGATGSGGYGFWRNCAVYFHNAGFFVTWGVADLAGVGTGQLTSTNWPNYHSSVISEATYLVSQGYIFGDFEIGNELEAVVDGTTLTVTQLNVNLRQLAVDVKGITGWTMPVSYGASNLKTGINDWISNGLGGLDTLSSHAYGSINPNTQTVASTHSSLVYGFEGIALLVNAFGSKYYVSEFNLDSNIANLLYLAPGIAVSKMQSYFNTYIVNGNVSRAMVYDWSGYLNSDNQFAQLYTNGAMNPMWYTFFQSNPIPYVPRARVTGRPLTPNRGTTYV